MHTSTNAAESNGHINRLMDAFEVSVYLGVSYQTIRRRARALPGRRKLSTRSIRYERKWIERWVNETHPDEGLWETAPKFRQMFLDESGNVRSI